MVNIIGNAFFLDSPKRFGIYSIYAKNIPWSNNCSICGILFFLGIRYGSSFANYASITFDEIKTITDILRSLVETIAIIIAGFWTYERFIKSREEHPYPTVQHRVELYKVELRVTDLIYLSVFATLTNEGKNKIDQIEGVIYVEQVFPLSKNIQIMLESKLSEAKDNDIRRGQDTDLFLDDGRRLNFEALGERQWHQDLLEPGQTVVIQFDFLIEEYVEVVSILNHYKYGTIKSKTDYATFHTIKPGNVLTNKF